jgi:hypothetical protein
MDVLQPRATYRRTATEDPEGPKDDDYELGLINSVHSFVSSKLKQPLLEYHPEYQASSL